MNYQDREPRVVELGQKVPVFEFPLQRWHGYSSHLSMNLSVCSALLLRSKFLPDLRFISIAESERGDNTGTFWIEADKDQLGELGILETQKYVQGEIPLPMPPAILGAPRWDGYYILNQETLDKVEKLRVHLFIPEGEYTAQPTITAAKGSRCSLRYAEGIIFEWFKAQGCSAEVQTIPANPKDEAYLRNMALMFTSDTREVSEIKTRSPWEGQKFDLKPGQAVHIRNVGGKLVRFVELDSQVFTWDVENTLHSHNGPIPPMPKRRAFIFNFIIVSIVKSHLCS